MHIIIFETIIIIYKIIMDPLQKPMTKEEKAEFEQRTGLRPYTPVKVPDVANPYKMSYHMFNIPIIAASLAGYIYAPKLFMTRTPFTISLMLVPAFYFISIHNQEKRFTLDSGPRRTLEQHLEFYPYSGAQKKIKPCAKTKDLCAKK